jgi:hypothetical protein
MRRFELVRKGQKTGEGVQWSDGLVAFRIRGEGSKPREAGLDSGRKLEVLTGRDGAEHAVRWVDG